MPHASCLTAAPQLSRFYAHFLGSAFPSGSRTRLGSWTTTNSHRADFPSSLQRPRDWSLWERYGTCVSMSQTPHIIWSSHIAARDMADIIKTLSPRLRRAPRSQLIHASPQPPPPTLSPLLRRKIPLPIWRLVCHARSYQSQFRRSKVKGNEEDVWSEMLQDLDHPNIVGTVPQLFSMMRLRGRVLVCALTCLVNFL
jgi:hypothetical protein